MQVSASIVLQDLVSPALMSVIRATRQTILALQQFESATDAQKAALQSASVAVSHAEAELERLSSAMHAASGPGQQFSSNMQKIQSDANRTAEALQRLNNAAQESKASFAEAADSVLRAVGGFYILSKGIDLIRSGFQSAVDRALTFQIQMEQIRTTMAVMMGDSEKANAYLSDLLAFAKHTPFQFPDLAGVARNLMAFGIEAEKTLPILNAIGDAVGAVGGGRDEFLMIASAFGDIASLGQLSMEEVRRLQEHGIPALQIIANQIGKTAQEAQKMISQGAIGANEAIYMLVKGIEEGTDGLAGKTVAMAGMMKNIKQTWLGALDTLATSLRSLGNTIVGPFFEDIKKGILDLASWINQAAENLKPIGERAAEIARWIRDHWSTVGPIIMGAVAAIGALAAAISIVTVATAIWNAVLAANPIIFVIAAIVALITAFITLWKTNDQFAAALYVTWNRLAAFFWTVVEAIATAFAWMAEKIGFIFDMLANRIIGIFNTILDVINRVAGTSFKIEAKFSSVELGKGIAEYARAQKELAESRATTESVQKFLESRKAARAAKAPLPPMPDVNPAKLATGLNVANIGNVGKVDKVGKIEKPVEIASEDLKAIRELAEINAINNFVTLTPTVQITTGDIRETADVNELIRRIEDYLAKELAVSTRRAYGV